ncbi:MAG: hypothetical protein ACAI34_19535 [Verrucomicrobium sp.]|nr:hypothetical protein [Verrucomicrobium sp.]
MNFIPPSAPPLPLTPEEVAIVARANAAYDLVKDRPKVSQQLQEKAAEPEEEHDDTPLI